MSEKKPKQSAALARLADSVVVPIDGKQVRVPKTSADNKVMNCILISRARALIEEQMKKLSDSEVQLTPKELKDLIEGIARMSEASAVIYDQMEGSLNDKGKSGDPVADATPVTEVSFSEIGKKNEEKPLEEKVNDDSPSEGTS